MPTLDQRLDFRFSHYDVDRWFEENPEIVKEAIQPQRIGGDPTELIQQNLNPISDVIAGYIQKNQGKITPNFDWHYLAKAACINVLPGVDQNAVNRILRLDKNLLLSLINMARTKSQRRAFEAHEIAYLYLFL